MVYLERQGSLETGDLDSTGKQDSKEERSVLYLESERSLEMGDLDSTSKQVRK